MNLDLTDDELVLLDQKCSAKVQLLVDAGKARVSSRSRFPELSSVQSGLVADVLSEAMLHGKVTFQPKSIDYCRMCSKSGGYVLFKSGYRKGQPNYKKPKWFSGIEFARRSVTIRGHVSLGGCSDCVTPCLPSLKSALRDVRAEVAEPLRTEGDPVLVRYPRKGCPVCPWEGHEGEMVRYPALMGGGDYPGGCPSCGHKFGVWSGASFKTLDGFVITEEPVKVVPVYVPPPMPPSPTDPRPFWADEEAAWLDD